MAVRQAAVPQAARLALLRSRCSSPQVAEQAKKELPSGRYLKPVVASAENAAVVPEVSGLRLESSRVPKQILQ
jgi:hypothetical protein